MLIDRAEPSGLTSESGNMGAISILGKRSLGGNVGVKIQTGVDLRENLKMRKWSQQEKTTLSFAKRGKESYVSS